MAFARFRSLSIRNKLLAMVLLPLAGVLPLLGLLLLWWGNEAFDRMLITKIRADLAVAQGYFERVQVEVGASTASVADSHALHLALAQPGDAAIVALLQHAKVHERLDFINLRAADGTLRASDSGPARATEPASPARRWADGGTGHTSVEILQVAQLDALASGLRERVELPLLPTRDAAPTERKREDRAMVLLATRAVRDSDGRLLGHVQGGLLLNRNLPFIDHINGIVYPEGSLPFGSRGTATLFLDDVRISTNVRLFGPAKDERAIGTRVSQVVRDAVLVRGQTWLDRAFVVNDWYVSAYQPIANGAGQRVGMLYVGYTERPFTLLKYAALASIGVIFFAVMIVAGFVSLRWARTIFRPIEQMADTMRDVEAGRLEARVGAVRSGDELGRLAGHLDRLLDVIDDKTRALQRWNAELDAKVAQRTAALEARTRELAAAQSQLLRSEKLAAVGQLTASIAHEVNNPIAVIQGNLDVLRSQLPAATAATVHTELRLIDEQIERMRLIVTQLLQFAKPAEYAGYIAPVDTARVLDDCLVLVGHLLARTRITVQRDFTATRQPGINRNELQQVLVNLLVNAIHAMPEGGALGLATRDVEPDSVAISVTDSGAGLDVELMDQLFQPFVTRKKDGTGLGLWISRSLVERYGGDLRAANRSDGVIGAEFTVLLRREPDTAGS
ncbi:histidine kinase [Leptothrix cholodnii SP-6]|uniref:histidine kinase n=2 Tax=Leptothrix cholodnii TaxID=34029 RepID=B1Y5U4_LEPCP|nr:histidine kinase [Leptothrix cholodnii SP-6]